MHHLTARIVAFRDARDWSHCHGLKDAEFTWQHEPLEGRRPRQGSADVSHEVALPRSTT